MFCNEKLPIISFKSELAMHQRLIQVINNHIKQFDRIEEDKALLTAEPSIPIYERNAIKCKLAEHETCIDLVETSEMVVGLM